MTYATHRPIVSREVPDSVRAALLDFHQELPRGPKAPKFSLARTLSEMHSPRGLRDGYERELLGSFALALGRHYDPHRVSLPFALLSQRDMHAGTASTGGHLVGEEQGRIVDALRGWSIAADGGAQIISATGNLSVPRNVGGTAATWLSTELSTITEVTPTISEVLMSPKNVSVYCEFSNSVHKLAPQLEFFLRQHLLGAVGQAVDDAVFGGSGLAGEPLGIANTPGVGVVAGAALSWAGVRTIRRAAIGAGAREENLMFVGGSTTQDILAGRERLAGGGHAIWNDSGNVGGLRAVATNRIPLDALLCGDFEQLALPLWGGVELEINPFANFQTGIQGARVMVSMDVGVLNPGAFSVATGVT